MNRCDEIEDLLYKKCNEIFETKEKMIDFFKFSSNLYKYSFINQVLIYAQKPKATACADMKVWNDYMKCMVKKGTKAIAILDDNADEMKVGYVFDVKDVVPDKRYGRLPQKWEIEKNEVLFMKRVQGYIRDKYNLVPITKNDNLATTLYQVARKIADEHTDEFMQMYNLDDNGWNRSGVLSFIETAIACPLILRLNVEEQAIYTGEKTRYDTFEGSNMLPLFNSFIAPNYYNSVKEWNIEQKVSLFSYATTFTKNILVDLAKYIRRENRAYEVVDVLNDETMLESKKQISQEMINNHFGNNNVEEKVNGIYADRTISGSIVSGGTEKTNREIWTDEKRISKNTEKSNLSSIDSEQEIGDGIAKVPGYGNENGKTGNGERTNKKSNLPIIDSQKAFEEFLNDDVYKNVINTAYYTVEKKLELIKAIKDYKTEDDIAARIYFVKSYLGAFNEHKLLIGMPYTFVEDNEQKQVFMKYYSDKNGINITYNDQAFTYQKTLSWSEVNKLIDKYELYNSFVEGIEDDQFNEMLLDGGAITDKQMEQIRLLYAEKNNEHDRQVAANKILGFNDEKKYIEAAEYVFKDKKIYMYRDRYSIYFKFDSFPDYAKRDYDASIAISYLDKYLSITGLYSDSPSKEIGASEYPLTNEEKSFEQLSLFDSYETQLGSISVDSTFTFKPKEITDEQINEMLRTGNNETYKNHYIKNIMCLYIYDYTKEQRIERLKKIYSYGSKGFYFDDSSITMYFDSNGFNFAFGDTAMHKYNKHLDWDEIDERIQKMVVNGNYYIEDTEQIHDYSISELETEIGFFVGDTEIYKVVDPDKYFEENLKNKWGGISYDTFSGKCSDRAFLEQARNYLMNVAEYISAGNDYRFMGMFEKTNRRKFLMEDISIISKGVVQTITPNYDSYSEPMNIGFITKDDIEMKFSGIRNGGSPFHGGTYRIYKYFKEEKADNKERAKWLKNHFGVGGGGGGKSASYDYDSKGVKLYRGYNENQVSIIIKWDKIATIIDDLIKKGNYLSDQQIVDAEREQRIMSIVKDIKENDIITFYEKNNTTESYIVTQDVNAWNDIIVQPFDVNSGLIRDDCNEEDLNYSFTINHGKMKTTKINDYTFNKSKFTIIKHENKAIIDGEHIMDNFSLYKKIQSAKNVTDKR